MNPIFDIHIFVCNNQRASGEKMSCGDSHGLSLVAEFKTQLNALKLPLKIRKKKERQTLSFRFTGAAQSQPSRSFQLRSDMSVKSETQCVVL
jgi:hypothetical protein